MRNFFSRKTAVSAFILTCSVCHSSPVSKCEQKRIFPFPTNVGYDILKGNGEIKLEVINSGNILGGKALKVILAKNPHRATYWLKTDIELPEQSKRVAWWIYSRGAAWANVKVILEEPSGDLKMYKAPSCGDSPWTRYEWLLPAADEAVSLLKKGKARGKRYFRGWTLTIPPFPRGHYLWGNLEIDQRDKPAALDNSWSFRDVDEDKRFQMAYSGFQFSYEGIDNVPCLPLALLLGGNSKIKTLKWLFHNTGGKCVNSETLDIESLEPPGDYDIILPKFTPGNYWCTVKKIGKSGELLGELRASYLIGHSQSKSEPGTVKTNNFYLLWPSLAEVVLKYDKKFPASISIPVKEVRKDDIVKIVWRNSYKKIVLENNLSIKQKSNTIEVAPPGKLPGQMAYTLNIRLMRKGKLIEKRSALLLLADCGQAPKLKPFPFHDKVFKMDETETISIEKSELKRDFAAHLEENKDIWAMSFNWDEIEPFPGFIQYPVINNYLAYASKSRIPVILTLYIHLDRVPQWLWYEQLQDQYGQNKQYNASYIRKISPGAEKTWSALRKSIKQIVTYYQKEKLIKGWNFSQGVESFWSDASRNNRVTGYSVGTSRAFSAYLKERGWSLEEISKASGTKYNSWASVRAPQPIFNNKLDLRHLWLEWENFKQQVPGRLFGSIFKVIREVDKTREIKQYAGMGIGDLSLILPVFKKYNATLCFGAGESLVHPYLQSICEQYGVSIEAESSAVPPNAPALLYSIFNKVAYGSLHGGVNVMWGRNFSKKMKSPIEATQAAAKIVKVINVIGESELISANTAVGTGMRSIMNQSRSFMWPDWCNLNTYQFADMLVSTISQNLQVGYISENTPLEQLRKWKLIVFTESPILSDQSAKKLAEYVYSGGTLLLQGQTGMYNIRGKKSMTLYHLLKSPAQDGSIVKRGSGRVVWLETPFNWLAKKNGLLKHIVPLGYARPIIVEPLQVKCALRKSVKKDEYFAILFGKNWSGGNPSRKELMKKEINAKIRFNLPLQAAGKWFVKDLTSVANERIFSGRQLQQGISVKIKPAELKILKISLNKND